MDDLKINVSYGSDDKFMDVKTPSVIPASDHDRASLFTDPLPGILKSVKITIGNHICTIEAGRRIPLTVLLPPINAKLYHFWVGGNEHLWQKVFHEHLDALILSGLLYMIKIIHIGFVGPDSQINLAKDILIHRKISFIAVACQPEGFEQVTMSKISTIVTDQNAYVLYCHNKGSFNASP